MSGEEMARGTDENRLTGRNVSDNFKTEGRDGHAFTGDDVFRRSACFPLTVNQRSNAVWVPEGEQTVARNDGHTGIASTDTLVNGGDGSEDGFDVDVWITFDAKRRRAFTEFNSKSVQEQFRVARGVDVAHAFVSEMYGQFIRVGEVAVVGQGNTVR